MKRPQGLSLAEAIVAIFILLAAFVVMVRLFHTGIRYQAMVDNENIAALLAERQMERIRGWSRRAHGCPGSTHAFSDWTEMPGLVAFEDPEFPGFEIQAQSTVQVLYSPCSLFEAIQPTTQQRRIEQSLRRVLVRVAWSRREHLLVSLVGLPTDTSTTRPTVTVSHTGASSLPPDASRALTTGAVNHDGRPVPDLFYQYVVRPTVGDGGGGQGAVGGPRDGRSAVVRNAIYDVTPESSGGPNVMGYGAGNCTVRAVARYRGWELNGESDALQMQSP